MAGKGSLCPFSSLPEDCIVNIISFTSPRDACRAAAVSRGFQSAAESDTVWECFLPPDYERKISESDSQVVFSTKRQLYLLLCDSGLLLDGGKLSFRLNKPSGKKSYMLCARKLEIAGVGTPRYWKWESFPDSRFAEVAKLRSVRRLDIRGTLPSEWLSPKTHYAAYLVFKLTRDHYRLDCPLKATLKCNREITTEAEEVRIIYIVTPKCGQRSSVVVPSRRTDGWMELELGDFYVPQGDRFDVECRLFATQALHRKRGLIVEGIEVRPIIPAASRTEYSSFLKKVGGRDLFSATEKKTMQI